MDRIEKYAEDNNIPIMMKDGIEFLKAYILKNNVKTILEIGTAIGYSAINMALVNKDIRIVTIERDENRYNEALKNIKDFGVNKQVKVIFADALDVLVNSKFDMIFIDAAKAQYIKFFEKFKVNLNDNGVIISDNLYFHGLVDDANIESRSLRALVRKINNYKQFLRDNDEFVTEFLDIGDGISISRKIDYSDS